MDTNDVQRFVRENVPSMLASEENIKQFAALGNFPVEAAKAMLEKMLKEPQIDEEAKKYIYSNDRSEDFKAFIAGNEVGKKTGESSGFAKGVAATLLLVAGALSVAAYAASKK